MRYLFILVLIPVLSFSQTYRGFDWSDAEVNFKTVQMKMYTDVKTVMFNGYKDASIHIQNIGLSNVTDATISAKLSGYFEIENGTVTYFDYKVKDYIATITYQVVSGDKVMYLAIYYDEVTGKPTRIFASTKKDIMNKKEKSLIFELTGFE